MILSFTVPCRVSTVKGELNHYIASFHQSLFIPNSHSTELSTSNDFNINDQLILWIIRIAFTSTDDYFSMNHSLKNSEVFHPILTISNSSISHFPIAPDPYNNHHQIIRSHPHVSIVGISSLIPDSPSVIHPRRFTALKGKLPTDIQNVNIFPLNDLVSLSDHHSYFIF